MRKRADQDDVLDAMFIEASKAFERGQNRRAYNLFRKAAELGHSHSQHNVALLLELGAGVIRDKAAAIAWYLCAWRRDRQQDTAENLAILYKELGNRKRERFWRARVRD